MLYPLQANTARQPKHLPEVIELRRIDEAAQLADVLAVQAQVWGRDFNWLHDKLATSLQQPDTVSVFCAYANDQPVGTGWTDYPPGSRFPGLHGGAVLPKWPGQSVYSALFDIRLQEARQRGVEWMAVDVSPMSHPILLAMGFVPICQTWPMRYRQDTET